MSDPRRLLDDRSSSDLKRAMLRAGRAQKAPPEDRARVIEALGLDEGAVSAGAQSPEARRDRPADWRMGASLFDAFLRGDGMGARRFGTGAAVAAAVHVALISVLILGSKGHGGGASFHPGEAGSAVAVRFDTGSGHPAAGPQASPAPEEIAASPERSDPPAPARSTPAPASTHAPVAALEGPREIPAAPAGEAPPAPVAAPQRVDPAPGLADVLPFGEGMSRPRLLEGPEPVYPREAREARVEGTLRAKCVITTTGALRGCHVVQSLPFLDQPVLEALSRRRYTPVLFQGRAVNVEYEIPFRFELP